MSVQTLGRNLAEGKIRQLAEKNGLVGEFTKFDDRSRQISWLSGEERRTFDETELLLTALRRAGVVSGVEAVRLHADYLTQRA